MSLSNDEENFWLGYSACKAKEPKLVSGNITPAGGDGLPALMQSPPGSAIIRRYEFPEFKPHRLELVA